MSPSHMILLSSSGTTRSAECCSVWREQCKSGKIFSWGEKSSDSSLSQEEESKKLQQNDQSTPYLVVTE